MCSCGHGCTVCAHVCGEQRRALGVILWVLGAVHLFFFFESMSLFGPELTKSVGQAGWPGSPGATFCLPSAGVTGAYHHT